MAVNTYAYTGMADAGSATTILKSIRFLIKQELSKISTASVVQIVRAPYDKEGKDIATGAVDAVGYVDVLPLVNQIDGDENATPHGTVYRLSYHRSQGGGNAIINDPKVGDIGKMVIADRDTSVVRATNKQGNPGSRRKFDKADGTYIGRTQADKPDQWITFTKDGIEIHDKNKNIIIMGPDGISITDKNDNTIITDSEGVKINGALINKEGDVISKPRKISLERHIHDGVEPGPGDTTIPIGNG